MCLQTPQANENIRKILLIDFDTNIDDVVFVGPYLYQKQDDGLLHIDTLSLTAIVVASLLNASSMIAIFYFGWKCYRKMGSLMNASRRLQNLQKQLFHALLVDSLIPIILMHLPVSFLLFSCLMEFDVGSIASTVTLSTALFPAIGALPPMFIIKNYRITVINYICCSKTRNQSMQVDN
ncbi:unnamed protein product [Caenorhabditis angaria]|uniref:7TM GPCR serpentine receptor class x (Srx) domain-containing protein n=1 Tax=Caenorhabditis angaria TaxID=860376 RepID=A0A9P1J4Q5_9PELO|nr:unnamed protein product [Caenorhabditis angaria]